MSDRATDRSRRACRGFTLVETVAFIAVAAVIAVILVQVFSATSHGAHYGKEETQAAELAQQRMEVISGQRTALGFSGFGAATYDPCQSGAWSAQQVCRSSGYPAGAFTVQSVFNSSVNICGSSSGTSCKLVTVTVTGPYGDTLAQLVRQFWDY